MSLSGFPDNIEVTTGSAWNGTMISEDEVLTLTKLDGVDEWTEDGTDSPNETTNRLKFLPSTSAAGPGNYLGTANLSAATGTAWEAVGGVSISVGSAYTFLDIWTGTGPQFSAGGGGGYGDNMDTFYPNYNPEVFKTMEEGGAGGGGGGGDGGWKKTHISNMIST